MTRQPEPIGLELYERFVAACRDLGLKVETGKFQAEMMVEINNNGPVTILLDSRRSLIIYDNDSLGQYLKAIILIEWRIL